MGNGSALAGFLLLFGAMSASPTSAQMPSVAGAFERLTPGNQKIARALYDAQAAVLRPVAPGSGARATRALTLDEIAAQKQKQKQGWGQVFQAMRSQGLVLETSLGQVVSRYEHQRSRTALTTASRPKNETRATEEPAIR